MKRPPIIVVVGSVDHGKTTLLDYVRKTNVAGREAGEITQSVNAYEISHNGERMTFIDTPGHEAFMRMRRRGAHLADLGILVVAADDSVQPQTRESITVLNETKTPYVVAINKADRVGPKELERVKNDLGAAGVALEGMGGAVSYHEISAKTGEGVKELLDLVHLAAEVENLTCDPSLPARGIVLEAARNPQRGIVTTAVLTDGTLRRGEKISAGSATGKVKILEDFLGQKATALSPSSPAIIIGFETLPKIGDELIAGLVRDPHEMRQSQQRFISNGAGATVDSAPSAVLRPATPAEKGALKLLLKADVAGSLEALSEVVQSLKAPTTVVYAGVGEVTDGDVRHAMATGSAIIAFRTRVTKPAKTLAQAQRIRITRSDIIYELVKAIEETIAAGAKKTAAGTLEVLAVFGKKDGRQIVGGKVTEGVIQNQSTLQILRNNETLGEAKVVNLQKKKTDAQRAAAPSECGLLAESDVEIKVGDLLIAH